MNGHAGPQNNITDVTGIKVGNAHCARYQTGVSVIMAEKPVICAVDVRGGGPGTRETEALDPHRVVDAAHALVLSGGSVYGLAAADRVTALLGAAGTGFSLVKRDDVPVAPIVPSAILFDLANGGDKDWGDTPPYASLGEQAFADLSTHCPLGSVGAGFGARAGAYRGGLGGASYVNDQGWQIGAIVAVNSFGSPYMADGHYFWAAPYELNGEFGNRGWPDQGAPHFPQDTKLGADVGRQNTTIAALAVNVDITQAEAQRLAIMAQDGLSRALRPVHAPSDGDVVFSLATGAVALSEHRMRDLTRLGSIAADCLARAIARGVYLAEPGNIPPSD